VGLADATIGMEKHQPFFGQDRVENKTARRQIERQKLRNGTRL
jgi:hypothetical protein